MGVVSWMVGTADGFLADAAQSQFGAVASNTGTIVLLMVTLSLIQGVVNTFVIFLSRVAGYVVDRMILKNDRGHGIGFFVTSMIAEVILGLLASVIVMWFSRQREYRADAGGASLAGRQKMIAALERLKAAHEPTTLPDGMQAFGISGGGGGLRALLTTHPSLDSRIAALRAATDR